MKLVLGTANFGEEYDGVLVPKEEQERIWDFCRSAGIDTIDTAVAYGKIDIPEDFKVITKLQIGDVLARPIYGALIHYSSCYKRSQYPWPHLYRARDAGQVEKIGWSVYYPAVTLHYLVEMDLVQIPYKNLTTRWKKRFKWNGIEIHVRKVFKDDCFEKALADPLVDKVIIGVENLKQLQENVRRSQNVTGYIKPVA